MLVEQLVKRVMTADNHYKPECAMFICNKWDQVKSKHILIYALCERSKEHYTAHFVSLHVDRPLLLTIAHFKLLQNG